MVPPKGFKHSEETKRKIGLNGFHYGMKGKIHTEETKRKISQKLKGRVVSETTKKLHSEAHLGKKMVFSDIDKWKSNKSVATKGKINLRDKNGNWDGGRWKTSEGYIRLWVGTNKYPFEHRIIMEEFLKRKLEKHEYIHHINGIKDDNRLENLKVVKMKTH